jgi:hypothetical protein
LSGDGTGSGVSIVVDRSRGRLSREGRWVADICFRVLRYGSSFLVEPFSGEIFDGGILSRSVQYVQMVEE